MKNKGFTLIELLAVIVILAIIALIATPIVLNIIDDTREESSEISIDNYMDAVINAIAQENLKRQFNPEICVIQPNGNIICDDDGEEIEIGIDGTKPTGGKIFFVNGKLDNYHNIVIGEKYYTKGEIASSEPYEPACVLVEATDTNSDGVADIGDLDGDGKADVGDLIDCGGQRFYVISNKNGRIEMLAEYNITLDLPDSTSNA